MAIDFAMPKLAMAMSEGTVTQWLLAEGDYVEQDAALASIETEKVAYDIQAPVAGYLHIVVPAGDTVDCDVLIAQFAESEDELSALQRQTETPARSMSSDDTSPISGSVTTTHGANRLVASPLARKMAGQNNLDLSAISGTGPGGRIVKRDILRALEHGGGVEVDPVIVDDPRTTGVGELARIPIKGTARERIATRMVDSLQSSAQLASSWESDISDLLDVRQRLVTREAQLGTKVSVNSLLIKAIVGAIAEVPIANSALIEGEIIIYKSVHMGIAMAMPGPTEFDTTLIVPVLRDAEQLSVVEIDRRMKALFAKARSGELTANDMSGSTMTLSSTAGIAPAGLKTAPILNAPNAMIVGPSTPIERPMVHAGEVQVRTMLPVSATFDHRVLDGEPFARFASALNDRLENPELLLA